MAIAPELRAQILRLFEVEHWLVGTIARQLKVHHGTVRRVLEQASAAPAPIAARASRVDPYLPFIRETLAKYPTLAASRLHAMVGERGYVGSASHFRHCIAGCRPRPSAEAYLRLRTLPGEQAQVDWAHFGHHTVGRARRPLMAFVMVLSYSRHLFVHFSLDARMDSFLRGHVLAFAAWGGVPRVVLSDNLKSAVLERIGEAIRFNPQLLAFAAHHRYEPRAAGIARGNEKGRVERSIRYIRQNFFAARDFTDVDDLNAQARTWCEAHAGSRAWPQDQRLTVREAFAQEQPRLLACPEQAWDLGERVVVRAGKTPYVRFDLNDYSVPHTHVRSTLTVVADPERVRVFDAATVLATHRRSFDRGAQIEDEAHLQALVAHKRGAREHRAADRLTHAVPGAAELLMRAGERGYNLRAIALELARLLDQYGAPSMQAALAEALARDVPHPNAVRLALEREREERNQPPPLALPLSERAQALDVTVRTHGLAAYDELRPESRTTDSAPAEGAADPLPEDEP